MLRRSLPIAALLLFCVSTVFAQSGNATTGAITGRVTDSSGGGLPGVTVTASSTATGLTRTVVTENDGSYNIALIPPGNYRGAWINVRTGVSDEFTAEHSGGDFVLRVESDGDEVAIRMVREP